MNISYKEIKVMLTSSLAKNIRSIQLVFSTSITNGTAKGSKKVVKPNCKTKISMLPKGKKGISSTILLLCETGHSKKYQERSLLHSEKVYMGVSAAKNMPLKGCGRGKSHYELH